VSGIKIGNRQFGVGIVVGAVALVVALVVGLWWFVTNNSVTNEGNKKESGLNSQYLDNQNYLSDCIVKIKETANVSQAQADKFEAVMVEAIKGRYEGREANPGQMFSAVVEQYPDLASLSSAFERVFTVVVGCRSDYRGKQTQLLDKLDVYTQWRTGSWTVRTFGSEFPSDNLIARVGEKRYEGDDALDKMYQIVQVQKSVTAYETGVLEPETPFGKK
jgi:hypothetical protein